MGIEVLITDGKHTNFTKLTQMLDADLAERYGELQKQYEQHNQVDDISNAIVICLDSTPVACGAFKKYNAGTVEMKRVFVKKEHRKQGLAKLLMNTLEEEAKAQGYKYAVLETGIKQYEAISFYKSIGYEVIQNYGPYVGNQNSICMKKTL